MTLSMALLYEAKLKKKDFFNTSDGGKNLTTTKNSVEFAQ